MSVAGAPPQCECALVAGILSKTINCFDGVRVEALFIMDDAIFSPAARGISGDV